MSDKGITFTSMRGNAKLKGKEKGYIFSLPAGHACPWAERCLAKTDRVTGKLTDGPKAQWRCFGASVEAYSKNLRACAWRNFEHVKALMRTPAKLAEAFSAALPANAKLCRVHGTGGDFLNANYLKAWLLLAKQRPECIFYCYSKRPDLLVAARNEIPANLRVSLSIGGKGDALTLAQKHFPKVHVVFTKAEAKKLGVPFDHEDKLAIAADRDFALLIHGGQSASSPGGKAMATLRKRKVKTGYSHRD